MNLADLSGLINLQQGASDLTIKIKSWANEDLNTDDAINSLDLFGFSREYRKSETHNPADLDRNGEVGSQDLLRFINGMK
jgi:hypothetical protein